VSSALEVPVRWAVRVLVVAVLWTSIGWLSATAVVVLLVALDLFWPLPVPDDEGCVVCGHAHLDHHGNCQACLRAALDGDRVATPVPCGRFRRWSPRTRWDELRAVPGVRERLRAL
jgi:hypothetical protein